MTIGAATLDAPVADASSILLLAPTQTPSDEVCTDLLTLTEPDRANVLSVTLTQSADDRLQIWRSHAGRTLPAMAGIISTDEFTRSAARHAPQPEPLDDSIRIDTVSSPGDLAGLGIAIGEFLSEWDDNENQTLICFHSLTTLLQYADLQRVFRFLHVLTGRVNSDGAVAHFHLAPGAHDSQTILTLTQLMDAVVRQETDGDWTVTQS